MGLYEFALGKLLRGGGLKNITVDLSVIHYSSENNGRQAIEIHCQTSGVTRCEVAINNTTAFVFPGAPGRMSMAGIGGRRRLG
jgi:hypothetical protein